MCCKNTGVLYTYKLCKCIFHMCFQISAYVNFPCFSCYSMWLWHCGVLQIHEDFFFCFCFVCLYFLKSCVELKPSLWMCCLFVCKGQWHFSAAGKAEVTLESNKSLSPAAVLSSAVHNILSSPQIALARLKFPFPLILPITVCVCTQCSDRTVHLLTLTMFLQGPEADVEVFGLFFRLDLHRDWKSHKIER